MDKFQLTTPLEGISCHAWNGDRTLLAISPNNNEIHIYEVATWKKLFVLGDHDLLVSALDWSPVNNKIVSCSHDRNAFVWTYYPASGNEAAQWKPALVVLRIDRAAIDVKWSVDGLRFAVTSAAKCVSVCTYELANDWWVSKQIKKKFKSTVLCCAFHPINGQVLATGSSDFKMRIYSTFIADVDGAEVNAWPFETPLPFGEPYLELTALSWVNAVAWSPSGNVLAFAGQDSSLHTTTFYATGPVTTTLRFSQLPVTTLLFTSEKSIVAGGHEFNPLLFAQTSGEAWTVQGFLDDEKKASADTGVAKTSTMAARDMFKAKAATGQDRKKDTDILTTQHENVINCLCNAGAVGAQTLTRISTTSLDGRLVVWNLDTLSSSLASLKI